MAESSNEPASGSATIDEFVGTLLGGRYELGRVLGAGGMGAVFEGRDLRLGRTVAVKVMLPGYARDAEYTQRFLREAQTASQVRHRNVVVILDYGETSGGIVYSVMEFLVGQDLQELLRRQPRQLLPWEQACGLLVQIASGLRAAHSQGVIHRDIKPANCFVTTEDDELVVKVVDFGIAKLQDAKHTQQLTSTGNMLGTPSYTAPEMVLTGGPASPLSDVYSLGVVAYRMLTGRLPFSGNTAFEVMHHACLHPVPPLREQIDDLPEAVEQLVLEMLAKTPEQRPADMAEVRQRLQALRQEGHGGGPQAMEWGESSALRLHLDRAGASGDLGERTEVLETRKREVSAEVSNQPMPQEAVPVVVTALVDALAVAEAVGGQTEVDASERPMEPTVAAVGTTEDSGSIAPGVAEKKPKVGESALPMRDAAVVNERPRKVTGWLVTGGIVVVAALGGLGWSILSAGTEASPTQSKVAVAGSDDAAEPLVSKPVATTAMDFYDLVSAGSSTGAEGSTGAGSSTADRGPREATWSTTVEYDELHEPRDVEPSVVQPKPTSQKVRRPPPSRPPSDGVLKKKLSKKIQQQCAAEVTGKKVIVSFFVDGNGDPSMATATPRDAGGECAKRQVAGTKFRARSGQTPIKIIVE
ncbi:MAG: serine/threonine-protein kinase [Nannocystaceae bacterium]